MMEEEPILSYISKIDEKINSGHKGLNIRYNHLLDWDFIQFKGKYLR